MFRIASPIGVPVSACRNVKVICSSVWRVLLIRQPSLPAAKVAGCSLSSFGPVFGEDLKFLRIRSGPRRSDGNDRRGGRRRSRGNIRSELFRRQMPQRAVRARDLVIAPASFGHLACVSQIHEPVVVQTFVAKLSVEALEQSVLHGLAALDEMQRHMILRCPLIHDAAGELCSVIYLNRRRRPAFFSQSLQHLIANANLVIAAYSNDRTALFSPNSRRNFSVYAGYGFG